MRAKNASDIRPYTLLSGWASVVPGVTTAMMRLEPSSLGSLNPPLYGEDNLPDPWSNPILTRIQRAFDPVLVADVDTTGRRTGCRTPPETGPPSNRSSPATRTSRAT
jgi:hypothetical protein